MTLGISGLHAFGLGLSSWSLMAASLDVIVLGIAIATVGIGGFILLVALLAHQRKIPPRVSGVRPTQQEPPSHRPIPERGSADPLPHHGPPIDLKPTPRASNAFSSGTVPQPASGPPPSDENVLDEYIDDVIVDATAGRESYDDDVDEIQVVSSGNSSLMEEQELHSLRLQAEASEHELARLAEARDEALRAVSRQEEQQQELQTQLAAYANEQETLRQANQDLQAQAEAQHQELETLRSELDVARADLAAADPDAVIQQVDEQHQATLNELRSLLGQHEAAEASLQRERLDLATQLEDARREIDTLQNSGSDTTASDDSQQQIASWQGAYQQSSSELSLANEQISQLNQNLNQRDAMVMQLNRDQETMRAEIAGLRDELEAAAQAKSNEGDGAEAAVAELDTLRTKLAEAEAELVLSRQRAVDLEQSSQQLSELHEEVARLQANAAEGSEAQLRLSRSHEELLDEKQSVDAQLASVQAELHQTLQQIELRQPSVELIADRDAAVAELEAVRAELARMEAASQEFASVSKAQIEQLQTEVGHLEGVVAEQAKAHQAGIDAEEHAALLAERETFLAQLAAAQSELEDVNQTLATRASSISEIEDAKQVVVAELEAVRADLTDLHGSIADREAEAEQKIVNLQRELEATQTQLGQANASQEALLAERALLQHQLEESDRRNADRISTADEGEAAEVDQATTDDASGDTQASDQADDAEIASHIRELEARLEQHEMYAQGLQAEKQDLLDQFGAAQEDINVKSAEMKRMRTRLQSAEESASSADKLHSSNESLQRENEELRQQHANAAEQLQKIQREQIELKQQLACMTNEEDGWNVAKQNLCQRLGLDTNGGDGTDGESAASLENSAGVTFDTIFAEIQRLQTEVAEKQAACADLESQLAETQDDHSGAVEPEPGIVADRQPTEDLQRQITSLTVERDQAAKAAAESSKAIADLMAQVQGLQESAPSEDDAEKLRSENAAYKKSVAELHAAVNELEEMKLEREREQETARLRLQEATAANSELRAEIAQFTAKSDTDATQEQDEAAAEHELSALQEAHAAEIKTLRKALKQKELERKEVSEQAVEMASQLEEIPDDRKQAGRIAKEAKSLKARLDRHEKKLSGQEVRLDELAARLSKSRSEAASLRSQLLEQKAIVRALHAGESSPEEGSSRNGTVTKSVSKTTARRTSSKPKKPARSKQAGSKQSPPKRTSRVPAAEVDDLKKIVGIGPALEKKLNETGIFKFAQVKQWKKPEIDRLDDELALGGRIVRDKWIQQARALDKR